LGSTRLRRPPAPSHAERARSAVARGGTAALVGTGCPVVRPLVHHVRADGSAILVLADAEPVLERVRSAERSGLPVMLELADRAPVDLRKPVRGLLWITGWLTVPDPASARRLAVHVADVRPHPALLDVGSGSTLVRLVPGSVVLADAEGTAALTPIGLAAARPDPFARIETHVLGHLEQAHPEVFSLLTRHLPPTLRDAPDGCGLRLRVETPGRDHDVRLAWQRDALTQQELRTQLRLLVDADSAGVNICSTAPPGVSDMPGPPAPHA
jgi:hypothetical protein